MGAGSTAPKKGYTPDVKRLLLASLLLLAASAARAAETDAAAVAAGAAADRCWTDKRCWERTQAAFGKLFSLHLRELAAALPGRFFPGTTTFVKERVDDEGHFLRVERIENGSKTPAPEQRDQLEENVTLLTLLESLPIKQKPGLWFDEGDWAVTPAGHQVVTRLQSRHSEFWKRVGLMVSRGFVAHW